jgi:hypothetical protein
VRANVFPFIDRNIDGAGVTPLMQIDSRSQSFNADACNVGPLANGSRFAVRREPQIVSFVSALCHWIGPSNISNLIMAVYVDAVERMNLARLSSDFGKKFRERMKPELNAASAVVGKFVIVWVLATSFRPVVSAKFHGGFAAFRFAMSGIYSWLASFRDAESQASTRASQVPTEALTIDSLFASAVATAQPHDAAVNRLINWADYGQQAKSFAC